MLFIGMTVTLFGQDVQTYFSGLNNQMVISSNYVMIGMGSRTAPAEHNYF